MDNMMDMMAALMGGPSKENEHPDVKKMFAYGATAGQAPSIFG